MKKKARTRSAFSRIRAGLEHATAFHAGDRQLTVRDVELKPPEPMGAKEVLEVRRQMRVSQAAFARILNVSPRTVQCLGDGRPPSLRRGAEAPHRRQGASGGAARVIEPGDAFDAHEGYVYRAPEWRRKT
jgi:DNA-binding transcriptional regulator YiaG